MRSGRGKEFDPSRQRRCFTEKHGDEYKLIGVMYTAQKDASENELNERIPLSIAQWHAHVNLCLPPRDKRQEAIPPTRNMVSGFDYNRRRLLLPPAAGSFRRSSVGWCMYIRSSTSLRMCGPWSGSTRTSGTNLRNENRAVGYEKIQDQHPAMLTRFAAK